MLENFYEKIMKIFTEGAHRIELHKARTQFFEWAGQFDETSNDFEVKMSLFTDWYLIDRPYEDGVSPIHRLNEGHDDLTEDELKTTQALQQSVHGIFEFIKIKKDKVYIKDIMTQQKYLISDFKILSAFSKEQFFEARIIELDEKLLFTGSFCFHPPQASKFILKEVKFIKKQTKKSTDDEKTAARKVLINKLFRMKHKTEQYKHIKIQEIYCNDSKVKV